MPPTGSANADSEIVAMVKKYVKENKIMIFSKSTCPHCTKVKDIFRSMRESPMVLELDQIENGAKVQAVLHEMTGLKTAPSVFVNGAHIGGCDSTMALQTQGNLEEMVKGGAGVSNAVQNSGTGGVQEQDQYDYDLVVVGGGSGGLAAAKMASDLDKKVCVLDYVKETPRGVYWGLGGTCVNVGCIPKKLMHKAALLGESIHDAKEYGWNLDPDSAKHCWDVLKENVQNHIGSLNWNYRVQLRDRNITYINSFAEFLDPHTIKATNRRGKEQTLKGSKFIMAVGLRPRYPDIPGAREHCISSDDLFSLPYCPGKTLCVGASYVSLECAGFLHGMGLDTTVMVRSILLRGFDQDMAERVGEHMEKKGVKFIRECVPSRIERLEDGEPGRLRVYYTNRSGVESSDEYNTVLLAIGRDACTAGLGLDKAGVKINPKNGKIPAVFEQSNVPHIYAVGDVLDGKLELTPVAIQAGKLLTKRMFAASQQQCDYVNVPTTVFTPLEYGAIGYAEEHAIAKYGDENIEVYHTHFRPLEDTVSQRENRCYAKIIVNKLENERVIGFHVLGHEAGEITQGYAIAMRLGATKQHFDETVGIHPTSSEVFTVLDITKRSGKDVSSSSC